MTFSAGELTDMRTTQDAHMLDTCTLQTHSTTRDAYGQDVDAWTDGSSVACGLDMRPGSERRGAKMTVVEYDATVRLPIGTTVDEKMRIKVTKRFGESITALVFDIVSPVQRGPSGIRLMLRKANP